MTAEELRSLIAVGRESESLEVKAGGNRTTDPILAARVVRAALGMTNHEGGGWIVIGIEEHTDGTFNLVGTPTANVATWNHDDISAMINGVADPHIGIAADIVEMDGLWFVVIRVHEFVDVPVVCRSQGPTPPGQRQQVYRQDVCYARSRRKPETVEASSDPTTWRTLMELAARKAANQILRVIGNVTPQPNDAERFAQQLEDLQ